MDIAADSITEQTLLIDPHSGATRLIYKGTQSYSAKSYVIVVASDFKGSIQRIRRAFEFRMRSTERFDEVMRDYASDETYEDKGTCAVSEDGMEIHLASTDATRELLVKAYLQGLLPSFWLTYGLEIDPYDAPLTVQSLELEKDPISYRLIEDCLISFKGAHHGARVVATAPEKGS